MINLEQLLLRRRISLKDWVSNLCSENQLETLQDFNNWVKNNRQYEITDALKKAAEEHLTTSVSLKGQDAEPLSELLAEAPSQEEALVAEEKVEKTEETLVSLPKKKKSKVVEEESGS